MRFKHLLLGTIARAVNSDYDLDYNPKEGAEPLISQEFLNAHADLIGDRQKIVYFVLRLLI